MSMEPAKQDDLLQPGQDIRPHMTKDTAVDLVKRLYGLRVKSVKELDSYDDKNYLINVEAECENPHIKQVCPDGYVLKVLNSMDSPKSHVEAEHQVQALLTKQGLKVPIPELNIHGNDLSREKIYDVTSGEEKLLENNNPSEEAPYKVHIVRLLTFIPGVVFHTIPYTTAHLHMVGQELGRLNKYLKDFDHPALHSSSMWDLRSVPQLEKFVYAVEDDENRAVINQVLKAFNETVVPVFDALPQGSFLHVYLNRLFVYSNCLSSISKLPTQLHSLQYSALIPVLGVIHGDYNEQNIIVKEKPGQEAKKPEEREYFINGVIDFGDLRYSCRVFDIAITVMYMMVESNVIEPLEAGGHVLAGYLTEMELSELEWQVLKECVAGRFAQSLVMGAYTYLQDPGNEYVLITAAKGWKRLKQLWSTPKNELFQIWKGVISSYRS